ncbi:bifunctional 4-hydroxy-2-oxoglutarate aldolase/2-dehydro-3-deoxy-phosphogluconate aldolase [Pontivivens ytuae]|uniref:2-dehydro-3-deoxy-phosphogluconate aldolase n=1 Tax=Pontivivens ytuae TaxID=2789856 RepID=A0A7S9LT94_9RHOB|nr:bifunctional 4-hydroxy-2-oxoglutarate aldolase/2-dehydro-3-deoxy-phosphogluconate aldolase [Pontivivens ytuae]QPH54315.1 bifunctional 4-hydroxy-2-oxoglutarate aldolase/2-dehydro-3-deoxy-phosphogluconate aldolase [Pontivivens ytuae]
MTLSTLELARSAPMIPVIVIEDPDHAVPLATALVAGGITTLEITLRSDAALEAIRRIKAGVEGAIVGAGTLKTPRDVDDCLEAGCAFGVSPGAPAALIERVIDAGMPFLPGCATPTEAMDLADSGFEVVKFFPASAAGGAPMLKALSSPLPHIKFCPTGGVSLKNAKEYLDLPNVVTVGGSWVAPKSMMVEGDWAGIEKLARETALALCNR